MLNISKTIRLIVAILKKCANNRMYEKKFYQSKIKAFMVCKAQTITSRWKKRVVNTLCGQHLSKTMFWLAGVKKNRGFTERCKTAKLISSQWRCECACRIHFKFCGSERQATLLPHGIDKICGRRAGGTSKGTKEKKNRSSRKVYAYWISLENLNIWLLLPVWKIEQFWMLCERRARVVKWFCAVLKTNRQ